MKAVVLSRARLLIASAAIAALASCGGGGGGGGPSVPTAPLSLNASNALSVAGEATFAGLGVVPSLGSTLAVPFSANVQSTVQPKARFLSRFMSQEFARVSQYLQSPSGVLAGLTEVVQCDTGNITLSDNRTIVSDPITSGSETFNACAFTDTGITFTTNGSITFSNITATSATVSFNLTFTISDPTASISFTQSGNLTITETTSGTETMTTLLGTEISTTFGSFLERLSNFSFQSTFDSATNVIIDTVSFTYASTVIGGSITVTTPTPFQTDLDLESFPHAGVMQIVGASGSTVRVTVQGNEFASSPQIQIQVDADGNGIFELTLGADWFSG